MGLSAPLRSSSGRFEPYQRGLQVNLFPSYLKRLAKPDPAVIEERNQRLQVRREIRQQALEFFALEEPLTRLTSLEHSDFRYRAELTVLVGDI